MGALTEPRDTLIGTAIDLSRQWCHGHKIDGSPALGHALKVARKVDQHLPDAAPDLIAAVVLHDAPYFAPEGTDLDEVLTERLSPAVTRIVRAIEREHQALDAAETPEIDTSDPETLVASAADKVVSVAAITRRARRAADGRAYWSTRRSFIKRVPYFRAFAAAAEPHLPAGLARELATVVDHAYEATAPYRWPLPHPARAAEPPLS